MAKNIEFESEARMKLKAGVDKLARAVAVTLGPRDETSSLRKNLVRPPLRKTVLRLPKKSN